MNIELSNCQKNINSFTEKVKGKVLQALVFQLDLSPTFNKNTVPFSFKYAHSVRLRIDNLDYALSTIQVSAGFETIWIENYSAKYDQEMDREEILVNEVIDEVKIESGLDGFYFKITIITENHIWIFYAGDIYDSDYADLLYVLNDEMILAFNDLKEADKMENLIKKNSA